MITPFSMVGVISPYDGSTAPVGVMPMSFAAEPGPRTRRHPPHIDPRRPHGRPDQNQSAAGRGVPAHGVFRPMGLTAHPGSGNSNRMPLPPGLGGGGGSRGRGGPPSHDPRLHGESFFGADDLDSSPVISPDLPSPSVPTLDLPNYLGVLDRFDYSQMPIEIQDIDYDPLLHSGRAGTYRAGIESFIETGAAAHTFGGDCSGASDEISGEFNPNRLIDGGFNTGSDPLDPYSGPTGRVGHSRVRQEYFLDHGATFHTFGNEADFFINAHTIAPLMGIEDDVDSWTGGILK